jgi:uncharacterized phage infection (PIP) family protein YhgE
MRISSSVIKVKVFDSGGNRMDALIATLGALFALFLVLAAAVEASLEMFRGLLERFGVTWLKGKTSLEEALKLASEVAPTSEFLKTKLAAIESAASQVKNVVEAKNSDITELKKSLAEAAGVPAIDAASAKLNDLAQSVKEALDADERRRIWVLKILSAAIGILLCWYTDFHVFQILAATPEASSLLKGLSSMQGEWLNRLVGGIAAAAGSNYWHDQLDRVRAVKSSFTAVKKLSASEA